MSRNTEAKKARRRKRRAARDARWIPDATLDELSENVIDLDDVNELLIERGWTFDDDFSDDRLVSWVYPSSAFDLVDPQAEPVTRMWMLAADDGEVVHVVLVGSGADHTFAPSEFFESLDAIEAYRYGQPEPDFGSRQDPG